MSFNNIRIGKKLGIGFGLLLILMVIICGVSVFNSKMTGALLLRIKNVDMQKITYADEMKDAIDSITRSVAVLPFATPEVVEEEKNNILITRPKYKKAVENLEKLLETKEEKDMLNRFKEVVKSGAETNNKIIEMVNQGNKQEAQILYLNETRNNTKLLVEATNNLIKLEEKLMEEKIKNLTSLSNKLLIIIIIVGIISIIIGIFMSIKITNSIKA
ncbi:MAG TPA: MCP four helix bundle domain-containing protein, partial [Syntrophorhabdaceae bacterium]|nr:MCP four helix bundle domain-containing protein [Syntrophorhabdaceae bacterium]